MYGLSDEDLQIQARAATFADELIPLEVTAELADGELPKEVTAGHAARARELGLCATNMPRDLGGRGYSTLQQVLVQEQVGAHGVAGGGDLHVAGGRVRVCRGVPACGSCARCR